jgi:hypothetical protein
VLLDFFSYAGLGEEFDLLGRHGGSFLNGVACLPYLLQWQPPSDFMTGAPGTRAMVAALALQAAWLWRDLGVKNDQGELANADKEACMVLLHQMQPMLKHVAASTKVASISSASSDAAPATASTLVPQQVHPSQQQLSCPPDAPPRPPADSALMLLMAAARTLAVAVSLGCMGQHCTCCGRWEAGSGTSIPIPAKGHTGSRSGRVRASGLQELGDVMSGLECLLSLASDLTLQGPGSWWEEAKQHHPLLLIQALMATAKVCRSHWLVSSRPTHNTLLHAIIILLHPDSPSPVPATLLLTGCRLCQTSCVTW